MGVKVNLLEEIRLRIQNAIDSGNLTSVKRLTIGRLTEIRGVADLPIIDVMLTDGEETDIYSRAGAVDKMRIDVRMVIPAKDSDTNKIYKTSDSSGAIFLLEHLQNAIDNNTSGSLDLGMNNTAQELLGHNYRIDYKQDTIEIVDTITIDSIQFTLGSR